MTVYDAPAPGATRIAVLSDAHLGGRGMAAWHNTLRYDDAAALLADAVEAASRAGADLLLALGDLADLGDGSSLCDVRATLSLFPGPVRVVPGNHDRVLDNETFESVFGHASGDVRIAGPEVERLAAFGLSGIDVMSDDGGLTCIGRAPRLPDSSDELMVVVSHYPLLNVRERLATAGLRDAGMLRNDSAIAAELGTRTTPTLVLNGHLHTRLEHTEGAVLQLSVGALVEEPHELTLVDIAPADDCAAFDVSIYRVQLRATQTPDVPRPVLAGRTARWHGTTDGWVREVAQPSSRPVLCLDWNGTVVDDDARARAVTRAVLDELGLPSQSVATLEAFRRRFTLPLGHFFAHLGVRREAVDDAVARWNELMLTAGPPALTAGAHQLLAWAVRNDVEVHVVSGAAPEVAVADLARLLPDVGVTSVVGNAHPKSTVLDDLAAGRPTWFVGDTTYDVVEGLRAGTFVIGLAADAAKAERLANAGADLVVTDLGAVEQLLARHPFRQEFR